MLTQAKRCSSWLASIRTTANFGKAWLSRQASQLFEAAGVSWLPILLLLMFVSRSVFCGASEWRWKAHERILVFWTPPQSRGCLVERLLSAGNATQSHCATLGAREDVADSSVQSGGGAAQGSSSCIKNTRMTRGPVVCFLYLLTGRCICRTHVSGQRKHCQWSPGRYQLDFQQSVFSTTETLRAEGQVW